MGTSGLKPACRIDATYAFQTACAPRIVLDQQIALSDQQIVYSTTEQMFCFLEWRFMQKRCIPAAKERFRQRQIAASRTGLPALSGAMKPRWGSSGDGPLTSGPPMIWDQSRASFSMRRCTALKLVADLEMAATTRSAIASIAGLNSKLRATSVTTRRLLRKAGC